jgi:hypothetical protein
MNRWLGYFAANGTFAPQLDEITYSLDFSFSNGIWGNHFAVLFDLRQAERKGLATGDTALAGASIVLQAKLYQELVDLFGNLPYSQAFQTDVYPSPVYDKGQDIYNALQLRLDTAIKYLGFTAPSRFISADIIAQGKTSKWVKFANTMKLRLLIRQSEVSGFNPAAEIAKIQANPYGILKAGESIKVNPGYSNDVNKQNPFYANNGWTPGNAAANTSTDANTYIIKRLTAYGDPRLERFFYPVAFDFAHPKYAGAIYGAPNDQLPPATSLSYYGPALVGNINASNVGDGSGAAADMWIYPSYESMFLYAEAVARGWITGNAATAYNNAVIESFVYLKVPNDTASALTYLTNSSVSFPAGTILDQAKAIAKQKYFSLVGMDPIEVYSDLRRVNMLSDDNSYISKQANVTSLPVRIPYPQTEYTSNSANALKEGTINVFTSKVFWQP